MPKFSFVMRRDSCDIKCDIMRRGGTFRCNLNGEVYVLPHSEECLTMFYTLQRYRDLPNFERKELQSFLECLLP